MKNNRYESTCTICKGALTNFIKSNDKMYGSKGIFTYGQCEDCECLQILNPPKNISEFYPSHYYSFKSNQRPLLKKIKRSLKVNLIFSHPRFLTWIVKLLTRNYDKFWIYKKIGFTKNKSILDVGSGSGEHIFEMIDAGFNNCLGIDAHIENDIHLNNKLIIKKGHLFGSLGKFDLITFHHSLEHIPEQIATVKEAVKCLSDTGKILIRIPTVSSIAFKRYSENWFQLDAPRHFYLHSHKSIKALAEQSGLKITSLWCDSNDLQFLISEEYAKGIFGNSELSYFKNKYSKTNKKILNDMKKETMHVNERGEGDQICVVLEKIKNLN
jgi:SAM-dependent methyltransferase